MEVHAHTHTARKKWYHYFWEFFMLFLAVTLGFFVENQREHSIEHQRLVRFAKQLINSLERDTTNQNSVLEVLKIKETCFDSLRYFLAMPKDDSEKWTGITRNAAILENPFRYAIRKPVFDQINYSGSLRLFTNELISDSLLDYIYTGTIIEWQTNAEVEYITNVVIPFMNTHFDKNLIEQRFETYIKKPGWDSAMIGYVLPSRFLEHVAEWKPVFENIVITAREKHEPAYLNILGQREKAISLISSLKKEFHLK
jgi:hypothetical protein